MAGPPVISVEAHRFKSLIHIISFVLTLSLSTRFNFASKYFFGEH